MLQLLIDGGVEWMAPLSIVCFVNVILFLTIIIKGQSSFALLKIDTIKQVAIFALALGVLGGIHGLYLAFASLSELKDPVPFPVIMGGMRVALLPTLYGLIIFLISMGLFFLGKMRERNAGVSS
jgi:hypothetical protein